MAVYAGFVSSINLREKWKSLMPPLAVKWEDLKVDGIYHIPPIDGKKRRVIKIIKKGSYWVWYTENFKEIKQSETDYLFSSDLAASFMFEVNKN